MIPLMLVAALSACAPAREDRAYVTQGDGPFTGEVIGGRSSAGAAAAAPSGFVLNLSPEMGRVVSVNEKPYADGWRQSASLDQRKMGGDWNDLAIDIRFGDGAMRSGQKIPMGPPTQEVIKREILGRFPGMPMRIVGRRMSNAMGPFGLAIGAAGRLRCAFAWQWVDDLRSARAAEVGGLLTSRGVPASIRMRICRNGVTADQLASWFELLSLDSSALDRVEAEWKQGTAAPAAEAAPVVIYGPGAAPVASTEVVGGSTLESSLVGVQPSVSGQVRRRHRAAVSRKRAVAATTQEPVDANLSTTTAVPQSSAQQSQGGRYLAPVDGSAPQAAAPQSAPAASNRGRFDPTLPAQAFRGPSGSQLNSPVPSQPNTGVPTTSGGQRFLAPVDGSR